MQRILTAVFDNRLALEAATSALVHAGFSRDAIHLGTGDPTGGDDPLTGNAVSPDASASTGVGNFLHTLFGTDNSDFAQRIDGAVTHGHQVLHLVADQADVERATALIAGHAPVTLETSGATRPSSHAGLSQLAAEPPGRSRHEAGWRSHHAQQHGGDEHYDEYAPAYLYGLDMATHEQHGGKAWQEAEPALRASWEQRHPQSSWSRFSAAVRHGWEQLRGE